MLKKWLIRLFFVFLLSFLIIEGMIIYTGQVSEETMKEDVDYIVILGAGVRGDEPSLSLLYRLHEGLNYAKEHQDAKIVLSGGQGSGENITEAEAMKRYLLIHGIKKERLILEDNSTSTYENMMFTKKMIDQQEVNDETKPKKETEDEAIKLMIVTNDFHMLRAKMLAERQGLIAYGLSAKTPAIILPKVYTREYFAIIKSFLFDR